MIIELLYFEGCPHHRPTIELVRDVMEELAVVADVREVEVRNHDDAVRLKFIGSPSIRVDGADVEPGTDEGESYALSCRMYAGSGVPPRDLVRAALSAAR